MTKLVPYVALAIAVFALGASIAGPQKIVERVVEVTENLGGAGPDVYSYFNVHGPFSQGGGRTSIDPVDDAYTLTGTDMQGYNVITFAASTSQPALTVTLPASTTFPLPADVGAQRTWIVENPFTAAATTTTVAAGTGVDLQEPDGQNVVIGINNYAYVTCTRGADSGAPEDIVCKVDETIPAD